VPFGPPLDKEILHQVMCVCRRTSVRALGVCWFFHVDHWYLMWIWDQM
jgi:hypothetical protein